MTSAILGGGISGLSTAYYLSKSIKNNIRVYESSQRVGGWIKSLKNVNGTLFELGPRTVRCGGIAAENTLELVKEIGLLSQIKPVLGKSEAARNRMVCLNNKLVVLPNSWKALFKIDPPFIKPFIYAIIKDLRASKKVVNDESIYDFVSRRFGEQYADTLISPMICGIYAGDAKEISVKALLNNLFEKEQKYGSVFGGMILSLKDKLFNSKANNSYREKYAESKKWSVWSLENGLETLPKHLSTYLTHRNVEINLNMKCTSVNFKNNEVLLSVNGELLTAEHLYSTLPSKDLANILGNELSELKKELLSIPFVSVVVVNLEYEGDLLYQKGFGFLVPPNQNLPILGIIFDSCIFPQKNKTILTVMMGGKWFKQYFGTNPDKSRILELAQSHVKNILKITKDPTSTVTTIMRDCIPQYTVGHFDKIQRIRNYIKEKKLPMTLIGNSFDGVGISDAILSAKKNVELALKYRQSQ